MKSEGFLLAFPLKETGLNFVPLNSPPLLPSFLLARDPSSTPSIKRGRERLGRVDGMEGRGKKESHTQPSPVVRLLGEFKILGS